MFVAVSPNSSLYWALRSSTPCSVASKLWVARNEVTYGTSMRWVTSPHCSAKASGPPMVRIEKLAPVSVSHSASADAIFIGCCLNMIWAWKSPEITSTIAETNIATTPKRTVGR